ncbi:MAG: sulfatase [Planctomycetes bacterium]|nr:sulfatase [Planctomycetota bacterium]
MSADDGARDPVRTWPRRRVLQASVAAGASLAANRIFGAEEPQKPPERKPLNVVFVFADQWRAQATGYAGDPNVKTPNLDALAKRSVNFSRAIASCPVCSPYRASLITGQYPLTHGVFINDVHLRNEAVSIAEAFKAGGYDTGYIGKWHLQGRGRLSFIPREDRQGFDFWRVCECTHDYNKSPYYADGPERLVWPGYDAEAQTRAAQAYIRGDGRDKAKPFLLMLSWGPPHNPYETAPKQFRDLYDPAKLVLRPNVPPPAQAAARRDLAGYYAHCTALDAYVGDLLKTIADAGLADDTIFAFTSDHGDMLGSQGQQRKQRPWDESIRVPFLLSLPLPPSSPLPLGEGRVRVPSPLPWGEGRVRVPGAAAPPQQGREITQPFNVPDIMPTLLRLCGLDVPKTVEGLDFSSLVTGPVGGASVPRDIVGGASVPRALPESALIACYAPFGEWTRQGGGREYRGVRTARHTYVETREGPWLLYDNEKDPYQLTNLVGKPEAAEVQPHLAAELKKLLAQRNDEFLSGWDYITKWGYKTDKTGTAPTAP